MEGQGITPVMPIGNGGDGLGFGGNSGLWLFAILALMWGGNGFFGGRGQGFPQDVASKEDVVYTSAFNQLQDENSNIISTIGSARADVISAVKDSAYNNLGEIRDLESTTNAGFANMQKCC